MARLEMRLVRGGCLTSRHADPFCAPAGNSLVNASTKALQCMATLCSCLKVRLSTPHLASM